MPAPLSTPVAGFPVKNAIDLQSLVSASLFGKSALDARGTETYLPISSLNLTLTGVVAGGEVGFALISVDGKPQELFAPGNEVIPGVVLSAVQPDRVLLRRGGIVESLLLDGADNVLPGVSLEIASTTNKPRSVRARESGGNEIVVVRDEIRAQVSSPQEFLSQAMLTSNAGGGFILQDIQAGSLMENLGLLSGDVVQAVNGKPLNTADDLSVAYQHIKGVNQVNLDIVRHGRREQLRYKIR